LTGNELTALLLESDEIKKYYPKYNSSQKRNTPSYGISTYQDRRGVIHIVYDRLKTLQNPVQKFYTQTQCRAFLEELCELHELCPRYCSLQQITGGCFHYHIKKCRGICRKTEDVNTYNQRVNNALEDLLNNDSYIIKEKGRHEQEEAIILIKNGIYQGFSFVSKENNFNSFSNYEELIEFRKDNIDIQRIIRSYLNNNSNSMNILNLNKNIIEITVD